MLAMLIRHIRGALTAVLVPCIVACAAPPTSSEPPSLQHARKLEARVSAQTVYTSPQQALADLQRALHLYSLVDEREGQLRCHLKLVRIYIRTGETDYARRNLAQAKAIAEMLQAPEYLYDSYLLEARLTGRQADFEKTLKISPGPIQRAVVLTYLNRVDEAYRLIETKIDQADDAPEDFAYVLYEYASKRRHLDAAETALELFKKIDHHRGIANALHLLAQINIENGHLAVARQYYKRALAVIISLGDNVRAQAIEAELSRL